MSIADMDELEKLLDEVTDCFDDNMKQVFDEVPEAFKGRTSQMDWHAQVSSAADDLREDLNRLIQLYETKLHQGEYK